MTKAEVQELALRLSQDERLDLGQLLIDSVGVLPDLTDEQKELARVRIERYEQDPSSAQTEDEFRASLAARLAQA